jgi:hypothetical protein
MLKSPTILNVFTSFGKQTRGWIRSLRAMNRQERMSACACKKLLSVASVNFEVHCARDNHQGLLALEWHNDLILNQPCIILRSMLQNQLRQAGMSDLA